jgi:FtsP/CotA-like multicopper oxidase with cupredoxin domain
MASIVRQLNGVSYPTEQVMAARLKRGNRYRLRMKNVSDDIQPIHRHRHNFEMYTR